jgi:hypothetical protein
MRVSYARSIGAVSGGLVIFTIFMVNIIAFMGGCCCYKPCKKRYPIETEPVSTTNNTQHTSILLKSKKQKFNVGLPTGNLTDTDVLSRNINAHQLSVKDETIAGSVSGSIQPMDRSL